MSFLVNMQNISKTYVMGENEVHALKGIDLHIDYGELTAIVGPSGSGKSTIMNILGLLDRQSDGAYYLQDRLVSKLSDDELARYRNKMIGFVFQSFFLLPRLTAFQNVSLPLLYRRMPEDEIKSRVMEKLALVGVEKYHHHKPNQLSGGQQQRVAIARALVGKPSVLLADEPTGALDQKTSKSVLDLFKQLNEKDNVTVVIITHDMKVAAQCKRQIHVQDGLLTYDSTGHNAPSTMSSDETC